MAKRKAEWQNNYISRTYDRLNILVPKGHKAAIQAASEAAGQSINGYVTQAIQERMEREMREAKS